MLNKIYRDSHGLPVLVRCSARSGVTKHCCVGFGLPDGSYVACGVPLYLLLLVWLWFGLDIISEWFWC